VENDCYEAARTRRFKKLLITTFIFNGVEGKCVSLKDIIKGIVMI